MRARRVMTAAAAVACAGVTACSSLPNVGAPFGVGPITDASADVGDDPAALRRELELQRARTTQLEDQLARTAGGTPASVGGGADYPPDARPGQCFARVLTPPATRVTTQTVAGDPDREEIRILPAEYETVQEEIEVEPQRGEIEVIPAIYEDERVTVLVQAESVEKIIEPAVFETEREEVVVRPAYTTWERGEGLFARDAAERDDVRILPTGEVMCRVEVPAEIEVVERRRQIAPPRVVERVVPAVYETVTVRRLVQPARTVERIVPAVMQTVSVRRQTAEPREERVVLPATSRTVERVEVVHPGELVWREVLCDTNTTPQIIQEVQRALRAAGYQPGPADGDFGPRTLEAMERFQRDNDLSVGALTRETVEALGVRFVNGVIDA